MKVKCDNKHFHYAALPIPTFGSTTRDNDKNPFQHNHLHHQLHHCGIKYRTCSSHPSVIYVYIDNYTYTFSAFMNNSYNHLVEDYYNINAFVYNTDRYMLFTRVKSQ